MHNDESTDWLGYPKDIKHYTPQEDVEYTFDNLPRDLPPGIWDNPKPDEMDAYDEFLKAWNQGEEELKEHWQSTAEEGDTIRALAYSCITKGCDCTSGTYEKADVIATADDGMWDVLHYTFTTAEVYFGSTYVIAAGDLVELPPADEGVVSALGEGWHPKSCFTRHVDVDVPPNTETSTTVINYARLKFWAIDNSLTGASAMISGIESATSPTSGYSAQTWERTESRVYWDAGAWTAGSIYYSPNIACVIQEIIDGPSWRSGDDILMFLDGYGTSLNEAYDYADDAAKSADLEIWWVIHHNISMSGGVKCDSSANVAAIYTIPMSGGIKLGTESFYGLTFNQPVNVHGRVWLSGFADVSISVPMRGGIKVNSTARVTNNFSTIILGGVKLSGRAVKPSFPSGFTTRHTIIVPAGAVTADLTGFLLGIVATIDASMVSDNIFAITDTSNNVLPHDFRKLSGNELTLYFKCDLLADSDNVFYLNYGDEHV
jgi:hypothetical protein